MLENESSASDASAHSSFIESAGAEIAADLFGTSDNASLAEDNDEGSGHSEGSSSTPPTDTEGTKDFSGNETSAPPNEENKAPPASQAQALPAPKTWRPEALASWEALPLNVQQEVIKREEDMFKGIEMYKAKAGLGDQLGQMLAPYQSIFQQANVNPLQVVNNLLQSHINLSRLPADQRYAHFQQLAQTYGVDLNSEPPFVDPQVAALQQKIADLQSRIDSRDTQEVERTKASIQAEVDEFASKPENIYFDEVASEIAALLKSGAVRDLKEAYEKAIWLNPVTREKEQARLTAEARKKEEAEAKKRAEEARRATSTNVKSKAKTASGTTPIGSMDDTLNETLQAIKGRTA